MRIMSPQPVQRSPHPSSSQPCTTLSPTRDMGVQTDINMKDVLAAISLLQQQPLATLHDHNASLASLTTAFTSSSASSTVVSPSSPTRPPASLLSLPDEVIERIFEYVAELPPGTDLRACGLSDLWWDETECLPESMERERNLRTFRLVSRDLLHLSMPIHLRWFSIVAPTSCTRPSWPHHVCAETDHQVDAKRLVYFLSASPPPRSRKSTVKEPAYGTYIRDLAFGHRAISASLGRVVLERVGDLMPNLRAVHLYSTASVSPSILAELIHAKLEFLEGITECSIPRPERNGDSLEESPHQDVLLRLLDARPRIQRFSTTGIALEGANSDRFLTILNTNRLYEWPGQESPIGLTLLHFANHCIVELALLEGLPKAAPNLVHFTIGSDCELVDTKEIVNRFSIAKVVSALPKLRHFAFLGQKTLPTAEGGQSTAWAHCGDVLKDGPKISYLDLRADQLSPDFFRAANRAAGPPHLLHQRLRHLILHASSSNWADVIILSSARRVRIFLTLITLFFDQGIAWPIKPEGLKDLFAKLKWMVDEREQALDAGELMLVVEVQEDGSARCHFGPTVKPSSSSSKDMVAGDDAEMDMNVNGYPKLKHELFGESKGVVVRRAKPTPSPPLTTTATETTEAQVSNEETGKEKSGEEDQMQDTTATDGDNGDQLPQPGPSSTTTNNEKEGLSELIGRTALQAASASASTSTIPNEKQKEKDVKKTEEEDSSDLDQRHHGDDHRDADEEEVHASAVAAAAAQIQTDASHGVGGEETDVVVVVVVEDDEDDDLAYVSAIEDDT